MERTVSITCALAIVGWALGGFLVVVELLGVTTGQSWGRLGVVLCCAGATLHVRSFITKYAVGYRNAYEMGRDAGRGEVLSEIRGGDRMPVQRIR